MRTRNSPQASRSSSSCSARRSRNAVTMPARSTSRRLELLFRTSVSSRSNGPSKASRSSSASDDHVQDPSAVTDGGSSGLPCADQSAPRAASARASDVSWSWKNCHQTKKPTDSTQIERDPEVDSLVEEVVGRSIRKTSNVRKGRVPGDVERKKARPLDREAPIDPEQDAHAEQIPDELVEESRLVVTEVRERLVLRLDPGLVRLVDPQRPRQARRLAVELLVPVVPPATHALREQDPRRDRVHHQRDAVAGALDDDRAGEEAERDRAPDSETAVPDGGNPYQWAWTASDSSS